MCSCGPPHMANQKQDDQLEHSYCSYVMIRDVTPKTCRKRWMIGRRGERGSRISVLAARHDDDDDDDLSLSYSPWSTAKFVCFFAQISNTRLEVDKKICVFVPECAEQHEWLKIAQNYSHAVFYFIKNKPKKQRKEETRRMYRRALKTRGI